MQFSELCGGADDSDAGSGQNLRERVLQPCAYIKWNCVDVNYLFKDLIPDDRWPMVNYNKVSVIGVRTHQIKQRATNTWSRRRERERYNKGSDKLSHVVYITKVGWLCESVRSCDVRGLHLEWHAAGN